jgi:ABC-type nitrate/sulfonate/bicarbonate transport system substrate-binding protein
MLRRAFLRTATLAPLIAASAAAPAWSDSLNPIRLTSTAGDDLRPVLYAQSTGLFKRAGLDLSLQIASSGSVAAQAVVAGSMDIAKASITALIEAYARGIPVVLVAPSMIYRKDSLSSGIVVAPKSPLRTARDLAGKVIATSGLGAVGDLGLMRKAAIRRRFIGSKCRFHRLTSQSRRAAPTPVSRRTRS